jgi:hypothetical protein
MMQSDSAEKSDTVAPRHMKPSKQKQNLKSNKPTGLKVETGSQAFCSMVGGLVYKLQALSYLFDTQAKYLSHHDFFCFSQITITDFKRPRFGASSILLSASIMVSS